MCEATILIADDEKAIVDGVKSIFFEEESSGKYKFIEAYNGKEAWTLLQRHIPEVLILDIYMPELNGDIILEKIIQRNLGTQVIIITAYGESVNAVDFMKEHKAFHFITKPIEEQELTYTVEKALKIQQLTKPAGLVKAKRQTSNLNLTQQYNLVEYIISNFPLKYVQKLEDRLWEIAKIAQLEIKEEKDRQKEDQLREAKGLLPISILENSTLEVKPGKTIVLRYRTKTTGLKVHTKTITLDLLKDNLTKEFILKKLDKKDLDPQDLKYIFQKYDLNK